MSTYYKSTKMQISVNIAVLKAQLAKYLRMARAGKKITILDHKMPIARIVPIEEPVVVARLESIKPLGRFSDVATMKIPPLEKEQKWDSLTVLLDDRATR